MKWAAIAVDLLVSVALAVAVRGQPVDPVADTTDWRNYFPLQVGNAWEHKIGNEIWGEYPERYERREIVGDTLIGDTSYFVHQVRMYNSELQLTGMGTDYLRYDTVHAAVVALVQGDSTSQERPWPDPSLTCDLSAAFYSDFECYYAPEAGDVTAYGSYDEGVIFQLGDLESSVMKMFTRRGSGYGVGFVHGVGIIAVEADFESGYRDDVIFVRLDGREYGYSEVVTDVEKEGNELPGFVRITSVHPSPFRELATVTFDLSFPGDVALEVYSVLGQRIVREALGWRQSGTHTAAIDGSGFASGMYFIKITPTAESASTIPIILQR